MEPSQFIDEFRPFRRGELAAALYECRAVDRATLAWPRRLELTRRLPFELGASDPAATLSASRIRNFLRCPYLHWMRLLKLERPRRHELNPLVRGTIVHAALEAWARDGADPGAAFDEAGLSLGPGQAFTVLDDPPMVAASSAIWLKDDDVVLGIVGDGEAHAFPAAQLAYHHIVNTTIAGEPYLVTY